MAAAAGRQGILFDVDGVFLVGGRPVPGSADAARWAVAERIPHLYVTNTTSHPRAHVVEHLARIGVAVTEDQVLTPAVAAREWLAAHVAGPVALFVPPAARSEFAGLESVPDGAAEGAAAVVLGDLGRGWDFATLNRAFRLLQADPRPALVSLGMTRYWRDAEGLQLDVGPFTRALEYAADCRAVVTGKPAAGFFHAAVRRLGVAADATVMVGDDVRGDVAGAQEAGLVGVLVRTGKFAPRDLELGITPAAVLDSVADLPGWWVRGGGEGGAAQASSVSPR